VEGAGESYADGVLWRQTIVGGNSVNGDLGVAAARALGLTGSRQFDDNGLRHVCAAFCEPSKRIAVGIVWVCVFHVACQISRERVRPALDVLAIPI
jgi:hypothetical protein